MDTCSRTSSPVSPRRSSFDSGSDARCSRCCPRRRSSGATARHSARSAHFRPEIDADAYGFCRYRRTQWVVGDTPTRVGPRARVDLKRSAESERRGNADPTRRWCSAAVLLTISPVLQRLRIENLVLIREADLTFAPGLNAITGETGAGKTILAQAIGLLLGARGDAALVGPDGTEAYVEAELDVPDGLFEEEGMGSLAELRPDDEDGLVLARRVFTDGRTRAYAWGRGAAREDLAAVGERLIAMSGQFEQRRLARSAYQLEL